MEITPVSLVVLFISIASGGWLTLKFFRKTASFLIFKLTGIQITFRLLGILRVKDLKVLFKKGSIQSLSIGELKSNFSSSLRSFFFNTPSSFKLLFQVYDIEIVIRTDHKHSNSKTKTKSSIKNNAKTKNGSNMLSVLLRIAKFFQISASDITVKLEQVSDFILFTREIDIDVRGKDAGDDNGGHNAVNILIDFNSCSLIPIFCTKTTKNTHLRLGLFQSEPSDSFSEDQPIIAVESLSTSIKICNEKPKQHTIKQIDLKFGEVDVNLSERLLELDLNWKKKSNQSQSQSQSQSQDQSQSESTVQNPVLNETQAQNWSKKRNENENKNENENQIQNVNDNKNQNRNQNQNQNQNQNEKFDLSDTNLVDQKPSESKSHMIIHKIPEIIAANIPLIKINIIHTENNLSINKKISGVVIELKKNNEPYKVSTIDFHFHFESVQVFHNFDNCVLSIDSILCSSTIYFYYDDDIPLIHSMIKFSNLNSFIHPSCLYPWLNLINERKKKINSNQITKTRTKSKTKNKSSFKFEFQFFFYHSNVYLFDEEYSKLFKLSCFKSHFVIMGTKDFYFDFQANLFDLNLITLIRENECIEKYFQFCPKLNTKFTKRHPNFSSILKVSRIGVEFSKKISSHDGSEGEEGMEKVGVNERGELGEKGREDLIEKGERGGREDRGDERKGRKGEIQEEIKEKRKEEEKEDTKEMNPSILQVDVHGFHLFLTIFNLYSFTCNASILQQHLKKIKKINKKKNEDESSKERKALKSKEGKKKTIRKMKIRFGDVLIQYERECEVRERDIPDPKKVNFGNQGGEVVFHTTNDGKARIAQVKRVEYDGKMAKSIKNLAKMKCLLFVCSYDFESKSTSGIMKTFSISNSEFDSNAVDNVLNDTVMIDLNECCFDFHTHIHSPSVLHVYARRMNAKWDVDIHLILHQITLDVKNIKKLQKQFISDKLCSKMDEKDERKDEKSSPSVKKYKKSSSFFSTVSVAMDMDDICIDVALGDGVDGFFKCKKMFMEEFSSLILKNTEGGFNNSLLFISSHLHFSIFPSPLLNLYSQFLPSSFIPKYGSKEHLVSTDSVNMEEKGERKGMGGGEEGEEEKEKGKKEVDRESKEDEESNEPRVVIKANSLNIILPYKLELRAVEDAVEDMFRALKLITSSQSSISSIMDPSPSPSTSSNKTKKAKKQSLFQRKILFHLTDVAVEIEEDPIQGWLDEHFRLIKNISKEAIIRETLAEEEIRKMKKMDEKESPWRASSEENVSEMKKQREKIQKQTFQTYKHACKRLPSPSIRHSTMDEFQLGFKFSNNRRSLTELRFKRIWGSAWAEEGGREGMIERIRVMDDVASDSNIPFSRVYGRNVLFECEEVSWKVRDYTFPLFRAHSALCKGTFIMAAQSTVYQPQEVFHTYLGRWRKVSMLKSMSGSTPPLKLYSDFSMQFEWGEFSYNVGYEPTMYSDLSPAISLFLRKSNLSKRMHHVQTNNASNASANASTNGSVNASVNASVDVTTNASTNACANASVNASPHASANASVKDSANASVNASPNDSVNASPNDSVNASVNASPNDSVNASVNATVNASVNASANESVNASASGSVSGSGEDTKPKKKERGLPWWDIVRYYTQMKFELIFNEFDCYFSTTTDPYEHEDLLHLAASCAVYNQEKGRMFLHCEDLETYITKSPDRPKVNESQDADVAVPVIDTPVFEIEVTMEWECPSGEPSNHYLHALPTEGRIRDSLYDPFRSNGLNMGFEWRFLSKSQPSIRQIYHITTPLHMPSECFRPYTYYAGRRNVTYFAADSKITNLSNDVSRVTKIPVVTFGGNALSWIFRFYSIMYYPPHKLRSFGRVTKYNVPRRPRSGNLAFSQVLSEMLLRIMVVPGCLRHASPQKDIAGEGIIFNMDSIMYELCYSRNLKAWDRNTKRPSLLTAYQGLHVSSLHVSFLDAITAIALQMEENEWYHPFSSSHDGYSKNENFILTSDRIAIHKQSPKANPSQLEVWGIGNSLKYVNLFRNSECDQGKDKEMEKEKDRAKEKEKEREKEKEKEDWEWERDKKTYMDVLLPDDCWRVLVMDLKLLWTIENRDVIWEWVKDISIAFYGKKPSPSRQWIARKKMEEMEERKKKEERFRNEQSVDNNNSLSLNSNSLDCGCSHEHIEDEEGKLLFMINVIRPQFNLSSKEAQGRFLLSASNGKMIARDIRPLVQTYLNVFSQILPPGSSTSAESQPKTYCLNSWNRNEFIVMLENVQAHVYPTHLHPEPAVVWLTPKPNFKHQTFSSASFSSSSSSFSPSSSPSSLSESAFICEDLLLKRVFEPCTFYFQYNKHKGNKDNDKLKPPNEISFNVPNITAVMSSHEFEVMIDIITNLILARLPKKKKKSNSKKKKNEDEFDEMEEKDVNNDDDGGNGDDDDDGDDEINEFVPEGVEEVELAKIEVEKWDRMCHVAKSDQKFMNTLIEFYDLDFGSIDELAKMDESAYYVQFFNDEHDHDHEIDDYHDHVILMHSNRSSLLLSLEKQLSKFHERKRNACILLHSSLKTAAKQHQAKQKLPLQYITISWQLEKAEWRLIEHGNVFAKAEISKIIFNVDRELDDVGTAQFYVKQFNVKNFTSDAKYKMILSARNLSSYSSKNEMLKVECAYRPGKDDFFTISNFEVELCPLEIHLTYCLYQLFWNYFFSQSTVENKKNINEVLNLNPPASLEDAKSHHHKSNLHSFNHSFPSLPKQTSTTSLFSSSSSLEEEEDEIIHVSNINTNLIHNKSESESLDKILSHDSDIPRCHTSPATVLSFSAMKSPLLQPKGLHSMAVASSKNEKNEVEQNSNGRMMMMKQRLLIDYHPSSSSSPFHPSLIPPSKSVEGRQVEEVIEENDFMRDVSPKSKENQRGSEREERGRKEKEKGKEKEKDKEEANSNIEKRNRKKQLRMEKEMQRRDGGGVRSQKLVYIEKINMSQVELFITYDGPRLPVNNLRLLMDAFYQTEFKGSWRQLFSKIKKHVIWSVVKSVTGMQGSKFSNNQITHSTARKTSSKPNLKAKPGSENDESGSENEDSEDAESSHGSEMISEMSDESVSDYEDAKSFPDRQIFLLLGQKKQSDRAGEGFVSKIRTLFHDQSIKMRDRMNLSLLETTYDFNKEVEKGKGSRHGHGHGHEHELGRGHEHGHGRGHEHEHGGSSF